MPMGAPFSDTSKAEPKEKATKHSWTSSWVDYINIIEHVFLYKSV